MSKTRPSRLWTALALLLTLAACGTTEPASHYRLAARGAIPDTASGPSLGVGPVSIPQYLDRDGIVRSDGANSVSIASAERWAEPLDLGVTRVLSLNLAGLLQTQNIQAFPWHPRRQPEFGIKVRLLAMDADTTAASMVAEWLVYRVGDGQTLGQRLTDYQRPLSGPESSASEIAAAYSELLYQLSDDIATTLRPLTSAPSSPGAGD